MEDVLATMITATTYGTWLRGDDRKWVDDGVLLPPNPQLKAADRQRMKHSVFRFEQATRLSVGQLIGDSLISRQQHRIYALTVQDSHIHIIIGATTVEVPKIVKCLKDAVRWGLRPGRPIWTDGSDKRFCFDDETIRDRILYVEQHNIEASLPARPWDFIERPDFGLSL
jgi:hypothetical protein